jgi:ABC-type nitrate/sulfonate/bicarbonate transport system substrate-binding protein
MTGDLPSVQYFFNNPGQYQTFAAIERDAKGYVVIARKDIRKPQDLAGKTIATRVGSTGSWFISEYLSKNGVNPASAIVKNLDTQLLPAALCKGDIAAFFIWQPIGSRTLEICPNEAHQLSDATGYIQGYLVAGARPEYLNSADGADRVQRFLRAIMKGRDRAEKDFAAVAAFAAKTYSLSEKATRDQWETNSRPIALDKVYYDDFCSLSKWARGAGLTTQPVDFTKLTWPNGLRAIDPKLAGAPPAPC